MTYYHRKPASGAFSIERVFADVRRSLPAHILPSVVVSSHSRPTVKGVLANMIEAVRHQGDVNHVTGDISYVGCVLDPRSTIVTFHDLGELYALKPFRRQIYSLLWLDLPIRRCRFITVVSKTTELRLVSRFPHAAGKVRVVYNPVSPEFQYYPKVFNERRPIILQMGTSKHKNLDGLIPALAGIPCELSIVGRPDEKQLSLLDKFRIDFTANWNLTGEALVKKYRECDLLVFPSLHEGFGLPIIEAQAMGRPVVTSNIDPMPEVAGPGACLVDPSEPESIRDGVKRIIEDADYRKSLVEMGLCNIQRFEPHAIARAYAQIYQEAYDTRQD